MAHPPTGDDPGSAPDAAAAPRPTLQGTTLALDTDAARREAIEHAFDYRGDVTLHTADGRAVEGYLFDRRGDGPGAQVRLIPADGSPRVTLRYDEVVKIVFSGRDTAAGKSFETWLRKYIESKRAGKAAELTPEPLDEPCEPRR